MPGMIRKNKKVDKTVYRLLSTPKDMQQKTQPSPPERLTRAWFVDSGSLRGNN